MIVESSLLVLMVAGLGLEICKGYGKFRFYVYL